MADSPAHPNANGDPADDGRLESAREAPPRTPRWVMVFGIIALVLILAVAVQFTFGMRHGPGLHSSYDSAAGLLMHLG